MPKLKVFRTTIGFHDAYVAAPSRAAALRAWGSSTDLFAMEAAEEVTDPALMKEPLAEPGTVIKQSRGTAAEHMAVGGKKTSRVKVGPAAKPPMPRPSRTMLDAADNSLSQAQAQFDRAAHKLDEEAAALAKRRVAIEKKRDGLIRELEKTRDHADQDYRSALDKWRKQSE